MLTSGEYLGKVESNYVVRIKPLPKISLKVKIPTRREGSSVKIIEVKGSCIVRRRVINTPMERLRIPLKEKEIFWLLWVNDLMSKCKGQKIVEVYGYRDILLIKMLNNFGTML